MRIVQKKLIDKGQENITMFGVNDNWWYPQLTYKIVRYLHKIPIVQDNAECVMLFISLIKSDVILIGICFSKSNFSV